MSSGRRDARDVGDKAKGFRLQRMRAVELLLDALAEDPDAGVACAVEYEADVRLEVDDEQYLEENKNYAEGTGFTFGSRQVVHAVGDFLAIYLKHQSGAGIRFGFYTNASVSQERNSGRVKALKIQLPKDFGVLESLSSDSPDWSRILPVTKPLVLNELHHSFCSKNTDTCGPVHVAATSWDNQRWISFLELIDWRFEEPDDQELEALLRTKIKESKFFETSHAGKDGLILRAAIDKFDERQRSDRVHRRLVTATDLENIFLKAAAARLVVEDPTWRVWETLDPPEDRRNISEKVLAVCPDASASFLGRLRRKTAAGLIEAAEYGDQGDFRASRLHVWNAAERSMAQLNRRPPYSEGVVEQVVETSARAAASCLQARAQNYTYSISNSSSVEGMVLALMDSCHLSFDDE